ncbi:MAG: 30S ribosome-binding factor RbfA [Clostridia bacterium]|nr:30S ribosome-binding factor RbfA [Clostridia bacterium]
MSNRLEKVNSLVKKYLSEIISNELNDPRLEGSMITISSVNVSPDLKYAKVFISVYGGTPQQQVLSLIKSASGYIKKLLAPKLNLRSTPTLDFGLDTTCEYSQKINDIIGKFSYSTQQDDENAENNTDN